MKTKHQEIDNRGKLLSLLEMGGTLRGYAFQNLEFPLSALNCRFERCIFVGCTLPDGLVDRFGVECYLFPAMRKPYHTFPSQLYTAEVLYKGYSPEEPTSFDHCYDSEVYMHYLSTGRESDSVGERLARSLHDQSISNALHDFIGQYPERAVVAVMGGHGLLRTSPTYRTVALIAKRLTESGRLVATGGGPGAMEAAHLGAWMAGRSEQSLDEAIEMLSVAPAYADNEWLASAFRVRERWPRNEEWSSLGIPTWFYGHEPATPFASHIAKYFDNSVREDGLLAIATGGIIYSPGSAGTMQEIFQDAAQNHYCTFGPSAPMIFLGTNYWREEVPVYPLMEELSRRGRYKGLLLSITDSVEEVEATLSAYCTI